MSLRGIGANQGRALGILVLMSPRAVDGRFLADAAFPTGDLTQGRRVLKALHVRGLIEHETQDEFGVPQGAGGWLPTPAGVLAFYLWFRNRRGVVEELGS